MNAPILTQWFRTNQQPVHPGYYDTILPRQDKREAMVLYWDGQAWRASEHSPRHTASTPFWRSRQWRGLAEKPASHATKEPTP